MKKRLNERNIRKFNHKHREDQHHHDVEDFESLCNEFADILDAQMNQVVNGVCVATRIRPDLDPTILGRRTNSPLAIAALFSFENLDAKGKALNLGETVILQDEIQEFISLLRKQGLIVTALHNHWLFDDPRLMYIHWESIDEPLNFAKKTARAFRVLEN